MDDYNKRMELWSSFQTQMDVSLILAKHILLNNVKYRNLVFSPISIQVVLCLIAVGSKDQTLDQLLSFLNVKTIDDLNHVYSNLINYVFADGSPSGGPDLSAANGIWIDKTLYFNQFYKQVAFNVYKADSRRADFRNKTEEAMKLVNSWVEKETMGIINEILTPGSVSSLTSLVIANALYFKGEWDNKFDASKTKYHDFHLLNGSSIQVPFMTSNKRQSIGVFNGFKVLNLPYKQGDKCQFSMYIFLPDFKDGLSALIEKLGSESVYLLRHIPCEEVEVGEFRIPKFRIEFEFEASDNLKDLGLHLPFSPCPGITEIVNSSMPLFVSKVLHKSFIEVDEEGTKAAAAATVNMGRGSSAYKPKYKKIDFVADHPFLFLVREDRTGVVQFIGHVLNPLENEATWADAP